MSIRNSTAPALRPQSEDLAQAIRLGYRAGWLDRDPTPHGTLGYPAHGILFDAYAAAWALGREEGERT